MFAIEPRRRRRTEEELRTVGIAAGVGHAQDPGASVLEIEILISEFLAIDRLAACAIAIREVAALAALAAIVIAAGESSPFLYNGGFSERWPDIRICGVLQRMAICYFAAAVIYLYTSVWHRIIIVFSLLMTYWGVMALVPRPGGTGGDFSFNGNLAAWIDSQFLPGRLYYGSWDPEGLLTTVPAIGSAVIGLLWGDLLFSNKSPIQKVLWFCTCGLFAINVGVAWDFVFPINKPLWTSSFVMMCAGLGSVVLGICYLLIEILQWRRLFFPFEVIGRNLLTAFMIMGLIPLSGIALRICGGDVAWLLGPAALFVAALTEAMLVWLILLFLYRHNISIRI